MVSWIGDLEESGLGGETRRMFYLLVSSVRLATPLLFRELKGFDGLGHL